MHNPPNHLTTNDLVPDSYGHLVAVPKRTHLVDDFGNLICLPVNEVTTADATSFVAPVISPVIEPGRLSVEAVTQ